MEINGEDGSKLQIQVGQQIKFGRGLGFNSTDRTVSRRHVSFQLLNSPHKQDEIRVHFQVIGKNPIWVHYNKTGEIKIYRSLESGEMESGNMFCVSGNKPSWFTLKILELDDENREFGLESQLDDSLNVEELDVDSIDISDIDPVKEFGFVVMGHEFDCYPKKMIRDIKNWDWFIDEPGEEESENDEVGVSKRKGSGRRKRRKSGGGENDDDEWTGESDEDKEVLAKSSKVKRPKYSTRSKGSDRPIKAAKIGSNSQQTNDEDEVEDEDDETLGGFIVGEDSAGEEPEDDEEEEEDDFVEEDEEE